MALWYVKELVVPVWRIVGTGTHLVALPNMQQIMGKFLKTFGVVTFHHGRTAGVQARPSWCWPSQVVLLRSAKCFECFYGSMHQHRKSVTVRQKEERFCSVSLVLSRPVRAGNTCWLHTRRLTVAITPVPNSVVTATQYKNRIGRTKPFRAQHKCPRQKEDNAPHTTASLSTRVHYFLLATAMPLPCIAGVPCHCHHS